VLGQLVNVDAAVGKDARISVDPANAGVRSDNSLKALSCDGSRHSLCFSLYFDGSLAGVAEFRAAQLPPGAEICSKDVYNVAVPSLSRKVGRQQPWPEQMLPMRRKASSSFTHPIYPVDSPSE
jgi:hypothetical protein